MTDEYYMGLALKQAQNAYDQGEIPIGAILVCGGEIIAEAHNLREKEHDATAHAEIIAIRTACQKLQRWRLTGCTLYVTIEPCSMCAGALINSRIDRLVYGAGDIKAGAVDSLFNLLNYDGLNHQVQVRAGVREADCRQLIKKFFQERRKK